MIVNISGTERGFCQAGVLTALMVFVSIFSFYAFHAVHLGFIYDDREQILAESQSLDFAEMQQIFTRPHFSNNSYYRPLARLLLKFQVAVFGKVPGNLHLLNCLLAATMALLFFLLLQASVMRNSPSLGLFALFVGLHPVVSSCVYMISGQEALLAVVFMLLATWFFSVGRVKLAGLTALAGMLCRENALMIVPFLTLFGTSSEKVNPDVEPSVDLAEGEAKFNTRRSESKRSQFMQVLPLWVAVLVYSVARMAVLSGSSAATLVAEPAKPVMAFLYLLQTVLLPDYDLVYEPSESAWLSARTLVAAILLVVGLFKLMRGSERVKALPLIAWVFFMFLPTANLLQQQTAYDERHNLVALPGFAGLCWVMIASLRWLKPGKLIALLLAGTLVFGFISHNRARFFADDYQFATRWLQTDPEAGEAWAIMGTLLRDNGQHNTARQFFEQAIRFRPGMASAYDNLGALLGESGKHLEAARYFRQAATLDPRNWYYRYNLGVSLVETGHFYEAHTQFCLAAMYNFDGGEGGHKLLPELTGVWYNIFRWRYSLTNPIF